MFIFKRIIRGTLILTMSLCFIGAPLASAQLSEAQLKLYQSGINYFDIAVCGSPDSSSTAPVITDGNIQNLAQQILNNPNISFWAAAPDNADPNWTSRVPSGGDTTNIDTRDVVKALAAGEKAYTTAGNAPVKNADINPNILKFIIDAGKKGKIMVNALTDKTHSSSSSNHYKGLAVDLDNNPGNTQVPLDQLNQIAATYKGLKNNETSHFHYDFVDRPQVDGSTNNNDGSIYMLGDSITVRAKDDLDSVLTDGTSQPYINASTNRSITKPGTDDGYKTSGLDAIDGDAARIKNAGKVIVALGTNQRDANFKDSIKELIEKIRTDNAQATIYWVNVFSESGVDKDAVNKEIDDASKNLDFNIIDTTNKNIELDTDKIHETQGAGTQAFASAVGGAIGSQIHQITNAQCSCQENGQQTALSGNGNEEKIYNYLTGSPLNLKPFQAAAIMGNMKAESGYEPERLQNVYDHKVPAETLSNAQLNNNSLGYGIVQWTPPIKMIGSFSNKADANDLGNQLKFLADQLIGKTTSPEKAAGDKIKASTDIASAELSFELDYERHAGGVQPQRLNNAKDILSRLGSGSGGGGSGSQTSSDSSACTTQTGNDGTSQVVGEYSLPVDKKWYTSNPEWFTKPHHDYPAADIPIPSGTKVFAVAKGKVASLAQTGYGGGAGTHVFITDGAVQYGYFHGTPGSLKVNVGDDIKPGQLLMLSDNTGHSFGPHLHFQIEVGGAKVCPQTLLDAIGKGAAPPDIKSLPQSGCTN